MTDVGLQCRGCRRVCVFSLVPGAGNLPLAFLACNLTLPPPDPMWWFCASPLPTPTPCTMSRPCGTQKSNTSAPEHLSSWWAASWTCATPTWRLSIGPGDPWLGRGCWCLGRGRRQMGCGACLQASCSVLRESTKPHISPSI